MTIAAKTSEPHPKLPGTIHTAAADIEAAGGRVLSVQPVRQSLEDYFFREMGGRAAGRPGAWGEEG